MRHLRGGNPGGVPGAKRSLLTEGSKGYDFDEVRELAQLQS